MNILIKPYPSYSVHSLMLLMVALVASSFPVGASIANAMPPEVMMLIRFLMAACLFAPYVFLKHGWNIPTFQSLSRYTVLSIPLVAFFWCMFEGLRYTSALNTAAIYTVVPAITAVYVLVINKERLSKRRTLGLMIGTIAAIWIVFSGNLNELVQLELNQGDALFFLGCLFLGAYNPLIKKFYAGEGMEVMTFWVILIGSLWLLLISLPSLSSVAWSSVKLSVYLGIGYLAIFTTLVTFFLLQLGTLTLGPTRVAAYGFLTPLFVIIINLLFNVDRFEWVLLPGVIGIFSAMFLVQREGSRGRLKEKTQDNG